MTKLEWIAQAVGIVAMTFNILSFQQKTPKRVITFQFFGSVLFALNYLLMGALVGMCMNIVGIMRAVVYSNREKFRADRVFWLILFTSLYILSYILTFTVFGTPFTLKNGIIELLPVIGMTATTVSFRLQNAATIRKFGFISSPCWLAYNIVNVAIGGAVCEIFSLCSIVIGTIRYDLKPRGKAKNRG